MYIILLKNGSNYGITKFFLEEDDVPDFLDEADQAGVEAVSIDLEKFFDPDWNKFVNSFYWNNTTVSQGKEVNNNTSA